MLSSLGNMWLRQELLSSQGPSSRQAGAQRRLAEGEQASQEPSTQAGEELVAAGVQLSREHGRTTGPQLRAARLQASQGPSVQAGVKLKAAEAQPSPGRSRQAGDAALSQARTLPSRGRSRQAEGHRETIGQPLSLHHTQLAGMLGLRHALMPTCSRLSLGTWDQAGAEAGAGCLSSRSSSSGRQLRRTRLSEALTSSSSSRSFRSPSMCSMASLGWSRVAGAVADEASSLRCSHLHQLLGPTPALMAPHSRVGLQQRRTLIAGPALSNTRMHGNTHRVHKSRQSTSASRSRAHGHSLQLPRCPSSTRLQARGCCSSSQAPLSSRQPISSQHSRRAHVTSSCSRSSASQSPCTGSL